MRIKYEEERLQVWWSDKPRLTFASLGLKESSQLFSADQRLRYRADEITYQGELAMSACGRIFLSKQYVSHISHIDPRLRLRLILREVRLTNECQHPWRMRGWSYLNRGSHKDSVWRHWSPVRPRGGRLRFELEWGTSRQPIDSHLLLPSHQRFFAFQDGFDILHIVRCRRGHLWEGVAVRRIQQGQSWCLRGSLIWVCSSAGGEGLIEKARCDFGHWLALGRLSDCAGFDCHSTVSLTWLTLYSVYCSVCRDSSVMLQSLDVICTNSHWLNRSNLARPPDPTSFYAIILTTYPSPITYQHKANMVMIPSLLRQSAFKPTLQLVSRATKVTGVVVNRSTQRGLSQDVDCFGFFLFFFSWSPQTSTSVFFFWFENPRVILCVSTRSDLQLRTLITDWLLFLVWLNGWIWTLQPLWTRIWLDLIWCHPSLFRWTCRWRILPGLQRALHAVFWRSWRPFRGMWNLYWSSLQGIKLGQVLSCRDTGQDLFRYEGLG